VAKEDNQLGLKVSLLDVLIVEVAHAKFLIKERDAFVGGHGFGIQLR
jgi:hypothetical protein